MFGGKIDYFQPSGRVNEQASDSGMGSCPTLLAEIHSTSEIMVEMSM